MNTAGIAFILILLLSMVSVAGQAEARHKRPEKPEVIPVQSESYTIKEKDKNILYSAYNSNGGKEISGKTFFFGACKVWVKTTISKAKSGEFERNNPDATFYPGDGFAYSFSAGWEGNPAHCRRFVVCPVETNNLTPAGGKCELDKLMVKKSKKARKPSSAAMSGSAEIPPDENLSGHRISLTAAAERWICFFPPKQKRVCGWVLIAATGAYYPPVLKPQVDINILQEYINDADGYKSGNLDGTYYLWDALNLVHSPKYKWKKERFGTISVAISKQYDLRLEKEFQCEKKECDYTLVHRGFEPWSRHYEYGDGTTVYNATAEQDIRKHLFVYKADLFNLGRLIHKAENKTNQLVVVYEPVMQSMPYLLLKDTHTYSWGDRNAAALHYNGSLGGGPDDTPGIHQKRRSKINDWEYRGWVLNQIYPLKLNQTLAWSEAHPQNNTRQRCTDYIYDPSSFEAKRHGTAMFVKEGWGKIYFEYPILHTMLKNKFLYVNATIHNTLQSSSFAGIVSKNLTSYKYDYPDQKFRNTIKLLTYDSEGQKTAHAVSVKLEPVNATLADYFCAKTAHDKNANFGDIIVGDMYGPENFAQGTGNVNLKYNKVSYEPSPAYLFSGIDPLEYDISSALEDMISPYRTELKVADRTVIQNRFVAPHDVITHVANIDDDNILNVTGAGQIYRVNPQFKFGQIAYVALDGKNQTQNCISGCTVVVKGALSKIEAQNVWGGHASAVVNGTAPQDKRQEFPAVSVITIIILAGIAFVMVRAALKKLGGVKK